MDYIQYIADRYSDDNIRKLIPVHLQKVLKNYRFYTDTWSNGRTLQTTFSMISGAIYNLSPIFELLSYADPKHRTVKIKAAYDTYSADNAPNMLHRVVPYSEHDDAYTIFIKHIPKGTSFITDMLNEAEETTVLQRMKNIELQLIQHSRHFIRIYKYSNYPNSYAILTNWVDTELLHKIMLLIPVIIGWKFYSEEELKTMDADTQKQCILENYVTHIFTNLYEFYKNDITIETFIDNIVEIFNAIVDLKDLSKLTFEAFTNNLANVINTKLHTSVKRDLDNTLNSIRSHERDLEPLYSKKQMLTKQLFLIEKALPEDVQPLVDALKITKAIEIIDTDDYELKIKVTAPLQFFDASDFKRYEANERSFFNDNKRLYGADAKYTLPIFHKIFVTHEYKLILQAIITLKAETSNYNADSLYVFTNTYSTSGIEQLHDNLPNPHHYYHNCWDRTKQQIRKAVTEGNYDLIPTLIVNSVQTVNVAENASFHKLLRDLTEENWREKTHLITKDGSIITWAQAIAIEMKNYKSITESVEETPKTPEEPEVTETIDEAVEQDIELMEGTIERTRDQLLEALHAQYTQPGQYTQVVIEEGETTEEDLEV